MSPDHDSYEDGLREGRLQEIERIIGRHDQRIDEHDDRFRILERIVYGVLGAIALIQLLPLLKLAFSQ